MTKTADEAKREYEAAKELSREAARKERLAANNYLNAILEETGLHNHLVEGKPRYSNKTQRAVILAARMSWGGPELYGRHVLKDGKIGQREYTFEIGTLTDLGPYSEPES